MKPNHPEVRRKTCSRCGRLADEDAFFRKNKEHRRSGQVHLATHAVCIGCELTERNDPTPEARALRKAKNSLQHHAEQYDLSPSDFGKRYGWKPERMAHHILHDLENTCFYCEIPYAKMGHGMSDITLDIINPKNPPYYFDNVRWCCQTCNSEKGKLPPELWSRRLIEWKEYAAWIATMEQNPTHGLPLFEAAQ
jgi:hypothetical protein